MIEKLLRFPSLLSLKEEKLRLRFLTYSLAAAVRENGLAGLIERLREIEPDIPLPAAADDPLFRKHWELKRRLLHAFQCTLALKALGLVPGRRVTVVDIGSTGTHLRYLKELTRGQREIDAIGVNIDPSAVTAMKARGLKAVLGRGEELHRFLKNVKIDLFISFETVEHLHNPALFFRRLATHFSCPRLVMTVPFQRQSRVGLFNVRQGCLKDITAEAEHIFELSPDDWHFLFLHAGWKTVGNKICYQYPVRIPMVKGFLSRFWRRTEFEGFWGAILERDPCFADRYHSWEE